MNSLYWDRDKDYKQLVSWWNFWKFPAPATELLPNTGIIVSHEGRDVVAGFLYISNSGICWIEFIVSNPEEKDRKVREDCIKECINTLCSIGKEMGYLIAFTSLQHKGLEKKYLDCGFELGSQNCNELIKNL